MFSISARRPFGFALNNLATFIAVHVLRYGRAISVIAAAAAWVLQTGGALAQDHRQNDPGQFDFYLLSLSWSPSFCEAAAERSANQSSGDQQCGERKFSFVVHGLWPQYEKGFPEFCQVPSPRLDRGIVSSMLDLMPSPHLIFHEWDRHGTCSGLSARAYFEDVRKARAVVKVPEDYMDLSAPLNVTPDQVEDAFVKANPGMTRAGISISCDSKRLNEVRICLTKDLHFRDCGDADSRSCRRDTLVMPPSRGG
jgi:ribonuclease T2